MDGKKAFILRMLFSELYKIMVNEVTFVGFSGGNRPNRLALGPPLPSGPRKEYFFLRGGKIGLVKRSFAQKKHRCFAEYVEGSSNCCCHSEFS